MISIKRITTIIISSVLLAAPSKITLAELIVQQWKQGLSGSKLTSYSGSVINSNSTLTVINFCHNGRYSYYKEGSWSVPGQAAGASNSTITGRWDIQQSENQVMFGYLTDHGESGTFPIYLQNDGRVNIGGTQFAVQQGGSGC